MSKFYKLLAMALLSFSLSFCIAGAQSVKVFDVLTKNYPSPGYLFLAPITEKYLTLVDHSGHSIYSIDRSEYDLEIYDLRLHSNGYLTFFDRRADAFFALDKEFRMIDSFRCSGTYTMDFHDIQFLPNGNYVVMGEESRVINMKQFNENFQPQALVTGTVIQELNRNHQLVYQWNSFDKIQIMDAEYAIDLSLNQIRYTHPNSIDIDSDGNWIVSFRSLDAIIKINRITGNIIWRLGGSKSKRNDFIFVNDTTEDGFIGFSHQHDARRTTSGNLLLFDNGNNRPNPFSRAVEYRLDEVAKTATKVWEYRKSPDIYGSTMGSAQRLANGNTLISWGNANNASLITEVRPDKSKALELYSNNKIIYRAWKHIFKVDAVEKNVQSTGLIDFSDVNNITNIKINADTLAQVGKLTVEKHRYKPHNLSFADELPLFLLPYRWTINSMDVSGLKGRIRLSITNLPYIQNINDIVIYYRSSEGSGDFTKSQILQVNTDNSEIIARYLGTGEYTVGLKKGPVPALVLPADSASMQPVSGVLSWKSIDIASSYTVQISRDPYFGSIDFEIENIKDTIYNYKDLLHFTSYFWRVAAKYQFGLGGWSDIRLLSTIIARPNLNSPINTAIDVPIKGSVSWEQCAGADRYHVQISERQDFQNTLLDVFSNYNSTTYTNLRSHTRYYWRAASYRGNHTGGWSDIWQFTSALSPPELTSPETGSLNMPLKFSLNWEKVAGASSYIVHVSDDSQFKTLAMEISGLTNTTVQTSNLKHNTLYFWRVRCLNNIIRSEWSEVWHFTTKLGAPQLVSPSNDFVGAPVLGYFTWEAVEDSQTYHAQIAEDEQFKKIVSDVSGLLLAKYGYSGLLYSKKYFWRVRSEKQGETSDWSEIWNFTTKNESSLDTPELTYPEKNAVGLPIRFELRWKPVANATRYHLQVSEIPTFSFNLFESDLIPNNSQIIEGFENRTTYYWRVRAKTSTDSSVWSEIWNFKTVLPYPALMYPEDKSTNVKLDPILTWGLVDGALMYQIQVSLHSNFLINIFEQSTPSDFIILPQILKPETEYFWRVNAIDKEGISDWTPAWKFTTEKGASVEINISKEGSFNLAPNPAVNNGIFNAQLAVDGVLSVKAMDLTGRVVATIPEKYFNAGSYSIEFHLDDIPAGTYILAVSFNGKTSAGTFIKLK